MNVSSNNTSTIEAEINVGLEVCLIIMHTINVAIHSFGIYLLSTLYKNGNDDLPTLYLINLSICECIRNALSIFQGPLVKRGMSPDYNYTHTIKDYISRILDHLDLIQATTVEFVYYGAIISLTFNRLLEICLNIKYPVYWNLRKGKYQLALVWVIGMVFWLVLAIYNEVDNLYITIMLVYIPLDILYLIIGTITYAFLFKKFTGRFMAPHGTSSNERQPNRFKIFRQSRFFICSLLIGNFFLLVLFPDLILFFSGVCKQYFDPQLDQVNLIFLALSDFGDACIYIFMDDKVKQLLQKTFRDDCPCCFKSKRRKMFRIEAAPPSNAQTICDTAC